MCLLNVGEIRAKIPRQLERDGSSRAVRDHQHDVEGSNADVVCEPDELGRLVRRLTGSLAYGNQLTGGADIVVDCVGSDESIQQSLAVVRPRGRVVLVGSLAPP